MALSDISVVIPAFNEEKYLPRTLRALQLARSRSTLPSEVILVDNNSTDPKLVTREKGACVIIDTIRNIAAVRNEGVRPAQYNLILSLDVDCLVRLVCFQGAVVTLVRDDALSNGRFDEKIDCKDMSLRKRLPQ